MTRSPKDHFIVIVGCGRLGSHLANSLSRRGFGVVAIDSNESAFNNLSPEYSGFRVEGDAVELEVLKRSKVNMADVVIATTQDDNVNLMVAQVAKAAFCVPRVMARVFDPNREAIYGKLGIETICPTVLAGDSFMNLVLGRGEEAEGP